MSTIKKIAKAICDDNVQRIHAVANARGGSNSMSGSEYFQYPPHGWPDFDASVAAGLAVSNSALASASVSLIDKVARAIIDQLKADAVRFTSFETLEYVQDEEDDDRPANNGTYDGKIDAEALARAAIQAILPMDRGLVEALSGRAPPSSEDPAEVGSFSIGDVSGFCSRAEFYDMASEAERASWQRLSVAERTHLQFRSPIK